MGLSVMVWANELRLADLIVKGTRENESTSSSGVTILTEEQLQPLRGQTLANVLRGIGGLDVAASGGAGQPSSVFIRGSKAEHTLVLIDGGEAADATTTTRFFDFSSLTVENIERIEIYRGAQSTRFGADAIGGVINIISKKGAGPLAGVVDLTAGEFATRRIATSVAGAKGAFNYSFGLSRLEAEGFSAADAGDGDERDGVKRYSYSTRLGWEFSEKTKFTFNFRMIDSITKLDYSGGRFGDDPNYESNARQILTGGVFETDFFEQLHSSIGLYYGNSNRQYDNRPDSLRAENYQETFESENVKLETVHRFELSKGLFDSSHFEAAAQYRREAGQSSQSLNGTDSRLARRQQAVFGESLLYYFKLSELKVDLGLRHDDVTATGDSIQSGSLSVAYDFAATGTTLHSAFGSGFKNPSLFQLYSKFGLSSLKSERATTFDFSIEQVAGRSSLISVTYFRNDFDNLIDFDVIASTYANVSRARTEGVELEFTSMMWQDWKLKAAATALQSRDLTTGLELLRRASRSFAVTANWKRDPWDASLAWRYVGRRDDIDPVAFGRISLSEYDVLDFALKYLLTHDSDVELRIENIFDRSYQEVAGYRTSRRAAYLSFAQRF